MLKYSQSQVVTIIPRCLQITKNMPVVAENVVDTYPVEIGG